MICFAFAFEGKREKKRKSKQIVEIKEYNDQLHVKCAILKQAYERSLFFFFSVFRKKTPEQFLSFSQEPTIAVQVITFHLRSN